MTYERSETLLARAVAAAERLIEERGGEAQHASKPGTGADPVPEAEDDEAVGDAAIRALAAALQRRLAKRDETGAGSGEGG